MPLSAVRGRRREGLGQYFVAGRLEFVINHLCREVTKLAKY
jgi:hypothetical protein